MYVQTDKIRSLVVLATDQFVQAGRIPAQNMPKVIDNGMSDVDIGTMLHGSIIWVTKNNTSHLFAVPAVGEVYKTTGGVTKMQLIAKWGEAAKLYTVGNLGTVEGGASDLGYWEIRSSVEIGEIATDLR